VVLPQAQGVGYEAIPTFVEPPSFMVCARLAPAWAGSDGIFAVYSTGRLAAPEYSGVNVVTLQHGYDIELRDIS
jgi:hypothetical protein